MNAVKAPWVLLAGLIGCTGTPSPDPAPEAAPTGWVAEVVLEPQGFATLLEQTGREGWVALHANDLPAATSGFTGEGPQTALARARAEWALALLHDDLARLSAEAHRRLFSSWQDRGGVQGGVTPVVAALSARCAGDPWKPWAELAAGSPSATILAGLESGEPPWALQAPADAEDDPVYARMALHRQAREGDLVPLLLAGPEPLLREQAEGFERTFYDPCLHHTLAAAWWSKTQASLGGDDWRAASAWAEPEAGLAGTLFAPWASADELRANLEVADAPGLLGASSPLMGDLDATAADDLEAARDAVRRLDATLDGWRAQLRQAADDDGQALLLDLGLLDRYRQEVLVARARVALLEDRPRQALAILQLARDVTERGVGASNTPGVLALLAEAELRTGRAREALDALQLLVRVHPEVQGIQEVVGDLAVLEGLDRHGDSKED